ncbi:MAG: lysozyme family protein [Ramlibacter sp.]|uniref:GPW/gp25 family protein n=1 Tax=Ramlibacter sp. TaxID=1917967 RepID=UPI0026355A3E|nr:GPW/gp25 family protein [Ramlibacter sp.]MDB5750210.1 lysozyme family protein [Ramlibacter sp.]
MTMLDHPYHFDGQGRTAATLDADHVRDLIEQVLFTAPGERVMRPDFGAGLLALVFEPNSGTLAATLQFLVQSALQQHLAHLIAVNAVAVENLDAALQVTVHYVVLADGSTRQAGFALPGAGGGAP